ncbi:hypothetical protein PMAYCL1PPCAC_15813, partial [Pristionchus mayeri]
NDRVNYPALVCKNHSMIRESNFSCSRNFVSNTLFIHNIAHDLTTCSKNQAALGPTQRGNEKVPKAGCEFASNAGCSAEHFLPSSCSLFACSPSLHNY